MRAFLIGLGFMVYFAAGGPGGIGGFHLAPGSLVVLFLLVLAVNPLLRRLKRAPLSAAELILIWAMLSVGLVNDLSFYLPVTLVGGFYFASAENGWAALFHKYLPKAFFPQDANAIRWFFEGLPKGVEVPWVPWAVALAPWLVFATFFYLMMFCAGTLLRAQWTDRERFSFPIVQIPVEMAVAAHTRGGGLFARPMFWIGMAIPVGIHLVNGLAQHFPAVPTIPLRFSLDPLLSQLPQSEMRPMVLFVVFAVIGFSFLLPLEISLSFAFFFLFYKLQCYIGGVFGAEMKVAPAYIAREFCQNQEIGAALAIFGGVVYSARDHLRQAWRTAFGPDTAARAASADEPMSYRWAFVGLAASLVGMVLWLRLAGVSAIMAGICLGLFLVIAVVISWAVTGGGQFFMQNSFAPLNVMVAGLGSQAIGASSFTMLRMVQMVFMYDMRSLQMPTLLHGFRAAEECGLRRSAMARAMAAALVAAILVGMSTFIWRTSHMSALKIGGWGFLDAPLIPGRHIADVLQNPKEPSLINAAWITLGALFTTLILALRARYLWFPLHPIGFAFAGSYAMYTVWFSFGVGWLLKLLATRYGGMRGFVFVRPFFIGLAVGDCLMASFWAIVGAGTRVFYAPFSGIA